MPRWSLNELKNLREVSFRSVPVADLESNFEFYGGIPRFVLELSEKDRSDRYRDQLGKVTVQQLIEIFKTPAYTDLPNQKMTSYLGMWSHDARLMPVLMVMIHSRACLLRKQSQQS